MEEEKKNVTYKNLLEKYCNRINYHEKLKVDFHTLKSIHRHHLQHIPFENIDVLTGKGVQIDKHSIFKKLIDQNRGGYCFEQNLLFLYVLKEIGFKARGITGRVIINKPIEATNSRSHLLVFIELNNESYICDVGFGSQVLSGPIKLHKEKAQATFLEDYRVLPIKEGFVLQIHRKNDWINLYKFDLQPQYQVDYKMANWYTSTHPDSHFTKRLSVSIIQEKQRIALNNYKFSIHYLHKKSKKKTLDSVEEIIKVLADYFGLQVSNNEVLKEKLQEILQKKK